MTEEEKKAQFDRRDVELLEDCEVFSGFFQVRRLRLRHRLFEGGWSPLLTRELFQRHKAVGVLLYDPALDRVALVEQFRVGVVDDMGEHSPWLLELVAGLIDSDESPEQVVAREAQEEAGCEVLALELIGQYFSSPGGSNEYFYLYCGRADLSTAGGVHGLRDEGEDIRLHCLSFAQCWQYLEQGRLNNAHTMIAMQWLSMHRQRLQVQWS